MRSCGSKSLKNPSRYTVHKVLAAPKPSARFGDDPYRRIWNRFHDDPREGKVLVAKSLSVDKDRATLPTLITALFHDLSPEKEPKIPTLPRDNQGENGATNRMRMPPRRRRASLGPRLAVTAPGARFGFPLSENRSRARPTCHRSPDDVIHELARRKHPPAITGAEAVLQHGHRLSLWKRPPTSQPEEDAPGTAPGRSPGTQSLARSRRCQSTRHTTGSCVSRGAVVVSR